MKINPLNKNIFSNKIDDTFNIFYIFGNNLGLIDICYSKLKKNLEVDLDNPFVTNYFDENKLLTNTEAFFDELNSISVFGAKKTIIVDIRQGDKKNDVTKIFTEFNFSEIKEIQLIIISYLFKQSDILSNILKSTVPFIMLSSLLPLFERALLVLNDKFVSTINLAKLLS